MQSLIRIFCLNSYEEVTSAIIANIYSELVQSLIRIFFWLNSYEEVTSAYNPFLSLFKDGKKFETSEHILGPHS